MCLIRFVLMRNPSCPVGRQIKTTFDFQLYLIKDTFDFRLGFHVYLLNQTMKTDKVFNDDGFWFAIMFVGALRCLSYEMENSCRANFGNFD